MRLILFVTDAELFFFEWNRRGNLEGFVKDTRTHKFTWQPHGSQFTIVEDIPEERLHLRIKKPEKLDKVNVLRALGFDKQWYTKVE